MALPPPVAVRGGWLGSTAVQQQEQMQESVYTGALRVRQVQTTFHTTSIFSCVLTNPYCYMHRKVPTQTLPSFFGGSSFTEVIEIILQLP